MDTITFTAQMFKYAYPPLNKYFGFEYKGIGVEISNSLYEHFEYHSAFLSSGSIEHLPDDFEINCQIQDYDKVLGFINSYDFLRDNTMFSIELILLCIYSYNLREYFYGIEPGNEMYDDFIHKDKCNLYEFLLDNHREYDISNLPKAEITISYGQNSQITIKNHENWLYNLVKNALYRDLTFGGKLEYERNEEPQKPKRAPSFSNFLAYNTYLMLIETIGADKRYPAEVLRCVIDFCKLCEVELIKRQSDVIGMKEFLSHANRQYQGEPMPFSLVK